MKNTKIRFKGWLAWYLGIPLYFAILLVLGSVAVYFYLDRFVGMCCGIGSLVYLLIALITFLRSRPGLVNQLVNFATEYGTIQKTLLYEFDIPYALLDDTGRLIWSNERFMELTGKDKDYHKAICAIFPEITLEYLSANESGEMEIDIAGRHIRIVTSRIMLDSMMNKTHMVEVSETNNNYLTAIYFYDDTKLKHYIDENMRQQIVVAQVYIDNYEEAFSSVEDVKKSMLTAVIDKKVSQYFAKADALVRKTEKDRYFVIFRKQFLESLKEEKFSILSDVKSIKVGNTIDITLSIGIGVGGDTYQQNYEYSRSSIDLALGRGGDQAVLREGQNISYYGASSNAVEKSTRVKARVKALALKGIFESNDNIIIMGHTVTDADAFGAAIGVYCAARSIGKRAQIVLNTVTSSLKPFRDLFTEENGYDEDMFIESEDAVGICTPQTVVMVVDTNRPHSVECPELLKKTKNIVVFDHHRQSNDDIASPVLSYIEPYASSACEMVAEVLQYFSEDTKLQPIEADSMYAGIIIDTNNFMAKTGVRTFEAAAYLKRSGAEVTRVRKLLRNDMSAYKARAEVVRNAEVYKGAFAISVCATDEIQSPTIVAAQAANELLNIMGIKASFVMTEYKKKIFISSRSIDDINVQIIMEKLGGGGHMNIAGAQLEGYAIADAIDLVKTILDTMIQEGEITL